MSYDTSNDSEMTCEPRSLRREEEGFLERCKAPSKPRPDLGNSDFQARAYEKRLRERLAAKYPSPTPAEVRNLEKQIKKLVEIYAQGRVLQQRTLTNRARPDRVLRSAEQARDHGVSCERG